MEASSPPPKKDIKLWHPYWLQRLHNLLLLLLLLLLELLFWLPLLYLQLPPRNPLLLLLLTFLRGLLLSLQVVSSAAGSSAVLATTPFGVGYPAGEEVQTTLPPISYHIYPLIVGQIGIFSPNCIFRC